ncbi:MAG: hypothetical protein EP317_03675 [Bacillota bacterium]|nr:MAG: hypothetical protein EP317_03675 [Bacillota bacterium]
MNKNIIRTTLFFGAIWGLLEATLGYLLQFLPPLVSGSIMFPIAATILTITYLNTKSKTSILWVGVIAAAIKSINFFMPGLLPIKTYNPMIAIMLQSIVMVGVCYIIDYKKLPYSLLGLSAASLLWRVLFYANITINHALTGFNFPQMRSSEATFEFVVTYGLYGALFAMILYGAIRLLNINFLITYKPKLSISLALCILAVTLTFYIQMIA